MIYDPKCWWYVVRISVTSSCNVNECIVDEMKPGQCVPGFVFQEICITVYVTICISVRGLFLYLQVVFLGTPKTYLPYRQLAVRDWSACATWPPLNPALHLYKTTASL